MTMPAWEARLWRGLEEGQAFFMGEGKINDAARALLTDPQTSGGLLVACAPDAVDAVLGTFRNEGFHDAAVVGEFTPGASQVTVR